MKSELYIGPAGWSYPDWDGIVYPSRKQRFDPLRFIASYFNLIEINNTFYRVPTRQACRSWVERVSDQPEFQFAVKAYRGLTHTGLPARSRDVTLFRDAIAPIHAAGRLGAVLIQFPWSYRFDKSNRAYIETLKAAFSPFPVCVEVRHGSWGTATATSFFSQHDLTWCGIDQPIIGNSLGADFSHAGRAGAYFRLHGRNRSEWFNRQGNRDSRYDYLYSKKELAEWSIRISKSVRTSRRTLVVLNNHFRGQAIANAFELTATLGKKKVLVPAQLVRTYPRLAEISRIEARDPTEHTPPPSLFD